MKSTRRNRRRTQLSRQLVHVPRFYCYRLRNTRYFYTHVEYAVGAVDSVCAARRGRRSLTGLYIGTQLASVHTKTILKEL